VIYSYEKFSIELGKKLRAMRIERGWTLRGMIIDHGFHLSHWQGFETGRGMSIPSLLRMCEVFDVPLEDLIGGIGRADHSPVEQLPASQITLATPKTSKPPKASRKRAPAKVAPPAALPQPGKPGKS
jgi:transcriptional regulator with XRE-family HTH domain